MSNKYIFWIDDPRVLYRDGKYIEIIPKIDMTRVEQMNAMTRFFIYILIILLLFEKLDGWICLPIVGIIFVVILYNIDKCYPKSNLNEKFGKNDHTIMHQQTNLIQDNDNNIHRIQSKYYDLNDKIRNAHSISDINELKCTSNEIFNRKYTCMKPTKDNPFMNPTIMDYGIENTPIACNSSDDDIKEIINDKFNENICMNTDDLFNVRNSQRMWYTVALPSMYQDNIEFANWLFKSDKICKNDQMLCLRYNDIAAQDN